MIAGGSDSPTGNIEFVPPAEAAAGITDHQRIVPVAKRWTAELSYFPSDNARQDPAAGSLNGEVSVGTKFAARGAGRGNPLEQERLDGPYSGSDGSGVA